MAQAWGIWPQERPTACEKTTENQTCYRLASSLVRTLNSWSWDHKFEPPAWTGSVRKWKSLGSGLSTLQQLYTVRSGKMKYCSNLENVFIFFTRPSSKEVQKCMLLDLGQTNWNDLVWKTEGKQLNFQWWQLLTDPRVAYCFANCVYISGWTVNWFENQPTTTGSSLHLWRHPSLKKR